MRAHCTPCGDALIPQATYAQPHASQRRVSALQRRFSKSQAQPLSVKTSATLCFLRCGQVFNDTTRYCAEQRLNLMRIEHPEALLDASTDQIRVNVR
jgi:hypothetical protein